MSSSAARHAAELIYAGEIRFGPPYYRLAIDGRDIDGRLFGAPLAWSDDGRLLAAQEWIGTSAHPGPVTRALLIDADLQMAAALRVVESGFAEQFRFIGGSFVYCKRYGASGRIEEVEVALDAIRNWQRLTWRA